MSSDLVYSTNVDRFCCMLNNSFPVRHKRIYLHHFLLSCLFTLPFFSFLFFSFSFFRYFHFTYGQSECTNPGFVKYEMNYLFTRKRGLFLFYIIHMINFVKSWIRNFNVSNSSEMPSSIQVSSFHYGEMNQKRRQTFLLLI